ncbi:CLUMA_CG016807, isoform A [Clunio marinus]|uniref:CLUMA_CG016807, isoform A n=1 Tax=Clunio marinus TaxID=568069 RepID=A0A1J1ITU7_9DIPT|nr:CLUMA_CG016807, isoform A [Clunio marinus]
MKNYNSITNKNVRHITTSTKVTFNFDMNRFEQNVLVNLSKASNKSAVTFSYKSAIKTMSRKTL